MIHLRFDQLLGINRSLTDQLYVTQSLCKLISTYPIAKLKIEYCLLHLPFPTIIFSFFIHFQTLTVPIPQLSHLPSHGVHARKQTPGPLPMRQSCLLHKLTTTFPKCLLLPRMPTAIRFRVCPHPRRPIIRCAPITIIPKIHRSLRAQDRVRRNPRRYLLRRLRCPHLP